MSEQIPVSTVTSAVDTVPRDYDARTVIEAIRTGGKELRGRVELIRETLQRELAIHGDAKRAKVAAAEIKKQLPAVLWSGQFSQRANDKLVAHSGLLCADLDSLNGELSAVREKLSDSPHLWTLFKSPSGDGLKAVFRVPADQAKHAGSFRAVEQHVNQLTGVQIDQACKDVARLCFLSYDPGIYHNGNAREIEPLPEPEKPKATPNGAIDLNERQRIAFELLGAIDWQSETSGFVVCPGKHLHTTGDNERDCKIELDKVPTLHCFHNSCRGILDGVNHELRSRIGKAEFKPDTAEMRAETPKEAVTPRPLGGLLDAVECFLRRYVVFSSREQATAIAVWVAHTWVIEAFDFTPYLHVWSADKRSGKTRLLDVLELLVKAPWRDAGATEAVLFRKIERDKPALLSDEIDTVFHTHKNDGMENIRRMFNLGFTRGNKVSRCVGQNTNFDIDEFDPFCAKVLCGIGQCLPDTVTDRSLSIELVRQLREEKAERFRRREAHTLVARVHAELEAWAQLPGLIEALRAARPQMPSAIQDRQEEICEPLLAIADMAGGKWPGKARAAVVMLCVQDEDANIAVKLLADIKSIFESTKADKLPTTEILNALADIEDDRPWAVWWLDDLKHDKPQKPATRLAKLLKPYKVKPCKIRVGDETLRGYDRNAFQWAWEHYLPDSLSLPPQAGTSGTSGTCPLFTYEKDVPASKPQGGTVPASLIQGGTRFPLVERGNVPAVPAVPAFREEGGEEASRPDY
jgi:hypothetical protein